MRKDNIRPIATNQRLLKEIRNLSHRILHNANREIPRIDFMKQVAKMLKDFTECDQIELWMKEGNHSSRCEIARCTNHTFQFEIKSACQNDMNNNNSYDCDLAIENYCFDILFPQNQLPSSKYCLTKSFWSGNLEQQFPLSTKSEQPGSNINQLRKIEYRSLAIIPLVIGDDVIGLLMLKSKQENYFSEQAIQFYEEAAELLGIALINQRAQSALRERVKELTCFYSLAQLSEKPDIALEEILQNIVDLIPSSWQYPEITCGRIILDGRTYETKNFQEHWQKQSARIVTNEELRGVIEVIYIEEKPTIDEGPFLREERSLIDAIAREIGHIIERREAEKEKIMLEDQLRHADRLATIGQLAAGVAHELNEPLGNILGFAQLIEKCEQLPNHAKQDIEKIVGASLYAREVIKKLMLFARETPPSKSKANLNQIIEKGLDFLEARFTKSGIQPIRSLAPDLPEIAADSAQLHQVLINLVVNAIQAMPDGGQLVVKTASQPDSVSLIVEDTGIGMDEQTVKQIFIPFFTTKDVDQGTGLGLAVVHGIVTSHNGTIHVDSAPGSGSKFEIRLPVSGPLKQPEREEHDSKDD